IERDFGHLGRSRRLRVWPAALVEAALSIDTTLAPIGLLANRDIRLIGSGCQDDCLGVGWRPERFWLYDIDTTFEVGPIFYMNPCHPNVAHYFGIPTDLNSVGDFHGTLQRPQYYDLTRLHVGIYGTVRANRDLLPDRFNRSFKIAIDKEIFLTVD